MIKRSCLLIALVFLFAVCLLRTSYATEEGHYFPGLSNLRDFIMPDPGLYFEVPSSICFSDSFCGQNGKKIKELGSDSIFNYLGFDVDTGEGGNFEFEGFQFATSPTLAWVTGLEFLGAKYALAVSPSFGYLYGKLKVGDTEIEQSDSGIGDLYVQPVWLGWSGDYYDIALGYGFFAPTGRYDDDRLANMGAGFWSHEFILTTALYLDKNQATAFVLNTTYEINSREKEADVRPGDDLCLEYGISQMLGERLEIGVSGYSLWQVTDDMGSGVDYTDIKDYVHGIGGELSYSMFNDKLTISGRYMFEYAARERFKGHVFVANFGYAF